MPQFPSSATLRKAANLAEKIEVLQKELDSLIGGAASKAAPAPKERRKRGPRQMSPEAREKIAAAQRKRWAKTKRESKAAAKEE